MAAVIYPDVNSLWDALTADWGAAGTYGLLLETYLAGSVFSTALGVEFDGTPTLYDVLVTGGIPAWPAAAAPGANISLAQVIREIYDAQILIAGYIDTEIGTIDTEIGVIDGIVDTIVSRTQYHVIRESWFSDLDDIIALTQAASDDVLPSIALPDIAGTIDRVYLGITISSITNADAGQNGLSGAVNIQIMKDDGAWDTDDIPAINLPDNLLMTAGSSSRDGVCVVGDIDVSAEVDVFNDTYLVRIDGCTVDNDGLSLYDVQAFLIVIYH